MSAWLLRQDAAVRALSRWLPIATAVALTMMGLIVNVALFMRTKYGASLPDLAIVSSLALVMWMTSATFLLTAAFRQRCGALSMTLPFTVERVWLAHWTAVTLVGLAMSIVVTGIGVGTLWLVARATEQPPLVTRAFMLQLGASTFVSFALAAAALQSRALGASNMPWNGGSVRLAAAVLGVGWGLTTILATRPAALLLVPTVATALLVVRVLHRLPPTFATVPVPAADAWPRGVDPAATPAATATPIATATATAGRFQDAWEEHGAGRYSTLRLCGLFLLTVHRSCRKSVATIAFGIPSLLFFGLLLAGALDAFDDDGSAAFRWISIPLTVYMLLAIFMKPLKGLSLI